MCGGRRMREREKERRRLFGLFEKEKRRERKKIGVRQTGIFHRQPDKTPSIPHPGHPLFFSPACFLSPSLHLILATRRVYFPPSKTAREERERRRKSGQHGSGTLGAAVVHRKPALSRTFNKSLSSSHCFSSRRHAPNSPF